MPAQRARLSFAADASLGHGHFFTAVVDTDAVLFAYAEHHTSEFVQQLFKGRRRPRFTAVQMLRRRACDSPPRAR